MLPYKTWGYYWSFQLYFNQKPKLQQSNCGDISSLLLCSLVTLEFRQFWEINDHHYNCLIRRLNSPSPSPWTLHPALFPLPHWSFHWVAAQREQREHYGGLKKRFHKKRAFIHYESVWLFVNTLNNFSEHLLLYTLQFGKFRFSKLRINPWDLTHETISRTCLVGSCGPVA